MDFTYPEGTIKTSGVPAPAPEAMRTDFLQLKYLASIFNAPNSQITVIDGLNSKKKFKERKGVVFSEPQLFLMLELPWLYGDALTALRDPNSAALTRSAAVKYFGAWENAIGKTIQFQNNYIVTINGILEDIPVNSDFPFSVIISYKTRKEKDTSWNNVNSSRQCFLQLSDNTHPLQIQNLFPAFEKKYFPVEDAITGHFILQPLDDLHFNSHYGNLNGRTISKSTLSVIGFIGVVLLITACINFVNLAIALILKRSREVGVRKVLGSDRKQLMLQYFGETFAIVLLAAILGLVLTLAILPIINPILNLPKDLILKTYFKEILFFLVSLIFVLTLIAGIYPAWIMAGIKPVLAMKNRLTYTGSEGISLRKSLVVVQFIIAQILLTVMMVIFLQVEFLNTKSMGFDKDSLVYFLIPSDSASVFHLNSLRNKLIELPEVKNISFSNSPPSWNGNTTTTFKFDQSQKEEPFEVNLKFCDQDYFMTYGIPILAGRVYQQSEIEREYVVNETFAKKLGFKNYNEILGKTITIGTTSLPIVGVIRDFNLRSLHVGIEPLAITTNRNEYHFVGLKLLTNDFPLAVKHLENIYISYFSSELFEYYFLDETLAKNYLQEERLATVINIFFSVSIFISCLGLYGLVSIMVVQRIKEVSMRKVLGASIPDILILFGKEFIVLVLIAFLVSTPISAFIMDQWLSGFAFHINLSMWIFIISLLGTMIFAMLTISSRSIKAATVNPIKSLKSE